MTPIEIIALVILLTFVVTALSALPPLRRVLRCLWQSLTLLWNHPWIIVVIVAGNVVTPLIFFVTSLAKQGAIPVKDSLVRFAGFPSIPTWSLSQTWHPFLFTGLLVIFRRRIWSSLYGQGGDETAMPKFEWAMIWFYGFISVVWWVPGTLKGTILGGFLKPIDWVIYPMLSLLHQIFPAIAMAYIACGLIGAIQRILQGQSASIGSVFEVDRKLAIRLLVINLFFVVLAESRTFYYLIWRHFYAGFYCGIGQSFMLWEATTILLKTMLICLPVVIVLQRTALRDGIARSMRLWWRHGVDLFLLVLFSLPLTVFSLKALTLVRENLALRWWEVGMTVLASSIWTGLFAAVWLAATVRLVEQWRVEDDAPRTRDGQVNGR